MCPRNETQHLNATEGKEAKIKVLRHIPGS